MALKITSLGISPEGELRAKLSMRSRTLPIYDNALLGVFTLGASKRKILIKAACGTGNTPMAPSVGHLTKSQFHHIFTTT